MDLSVQFSNGFHDLVSTFVHRIWGNYNSTIGESLIGPERVLHNNWAYTLDLGEKKALLASLLKRSPPLFSFHLRGGNEP